MERPIIFTTEMVRAIIDGTKTQTRRAIKEPVSISQNGLPHGPMIRHHGSWWLPNEWSPYGILGERLWVRELFTNGDDRIIYRADIPDNTLGFKWVSSRFMPHWASRITLEIVNVRAERVQEITGEDARAEGVEKYSSIVNFAMLWDSLNAKRGYGWDTNPWVWVIKFRRI